MLRIAVVRHAIAEDRNAALHARHPDAQRALTPDGRRKMELAAAGLRRILPQPGLVACSPLVRARETAQIITHVYGTGTPGPVQTETLAPGFEPRALLEWTRHHAAGTAPVVLVGHEPDLGRWVAWCMGCAGSAPLEFKKGAACLLEFPAAAGPGEAQLHWALTPRLLRRLGEAG
ncbi:histidine phosphatase superfamily [bacterium BMS3Bbin12]|nr:histidine phosphatase superfamily [bacterium BMS3Abin12]GBE47703.1 histidine phosphatase superfamily [bacterium BMS3Bbin12]GBE49945.1 histidine phosphatase superfamily [bacterium BMS3Bbin13]